MTVEILRQMVRENARIAQDQTEYQRRYDAIAQRYETAKAQLDATAQTITRCNGKRVELERFLRILQARDGLLTEFDEELWNAVIEKVIVKSDAIAVFVFRDGSEAEWRIG